MLSSGSFFPAFFLIISISSAVLGANVLQANPKHTVNRLFFLIALTLGVSAFGYAIAIEAPSLEACLVWRRVAAFGWSVIFALLVHFSLVFSGSRRILSRWWVYVVLYLPAALCVCGFTMVDDIALQQFDLVRVGSVWVNKNIPNGWDYFYDIYLILYSVITLALLLRKYRASSGKEKRHTRILLVSFGAAILFGTLTDVLNTIFQLVTMPQIAPFALLIPTIAIYYSMRRHDLMMSSEVSEQEIILSKSLRKRLFSYFFIIPIAGGIVFFVSEYLLAGKPLNMVLLTSIGFMLTGAVGVLFYYMSKTHRLILILFSVAAIIIIPGVMYIFAMNADVTMRALPFLFIIVSMLFNDRRLLITTSISAIISLAAIWIMAPKADVHINSADYIIYLFNLIVGIWVGLFVNKTYLRRLAETVLKNRLQVLNIDISKQLLYVKPANQDERFEKVLQLIGETYKSDIVILCLDNNKRNKGIQSYIWEPENIIAPVITAEDAVKISELFNKQLLTVSGNASQNSLPSGMDEIFARIGLSAVLSIPLDFSEELTGFLAVGKKTPRNWTKAETESLRILVNNLSDSLVRLSAQHEIEFLAFHDHLTSLPNKSLFDEHAEQAIRLAERTGKQLGVVFLDLDSFKAVNDSLGHKDGDALICEIAAKLRGCLGKSETVCRFGGDEFLLLLQNIKDKAGLTKVMDKIMKIFEQPIWLQGQEIFITASAGVAVYPQDGETSNELVKNADIAMYSAKDDGKNRYHFCSQDMKEKINYKARLTNLLYRALERGELSLEYQPLINLQHSSITGAEALLRWHQSQMGAISPAVFIPLAEKCGMINAIGEWVLTQACRQMVEWQKKGLPTIRITVNISVNQLRNPGFVEQVNTVLKRTGLEAGLLELEVTESVAIQEPDYIVNLLTRLKALGVTVSIDDFGMEYSSLSRLKQLPVDRIKLDMHFVRGINKDEKDEAIANVIINLAKSLNLRIIAEGVETAEQLDHLRSKMCDEVQGFLFYRPLPAEEMEKVLRGGLEAPSRSVAAAVQ